MTKAEIEKRLVVAETMFIKLYRHFEGDLLKALVKLEDSPDDFYKEMLGYKMIINPFTRCDDGYDCKNCKKFFNIKYKEIIDDIHHSL